jgi:hypothetical protein
MRHFFYYVCFVGKINLHQSSVSAVHYCICKWQYCIVVTFRYKLKTDEIQSPLETVRFTVHCLPVSCLQYTYTVKMYWRLYGCETWFLSLSAVESRLLRGVFGHGGEENRRIGNNYVKKRFIILTNFFLFGWRAPQQMLRTHRSLKAYCTTLWWRWLNFFRFSV